jgi:hypothetical protein
MGRSDGKDKEAEVVLDPITGKPIADYRINSLVVGPEELAEELDDEITGPEDDYIKPNPERSRSGVQLIAHVEDPDDISEMLPKLRAQWRQARKDLGLDD